MSEINSEILGKIRELIDAVKRQKSGRNLSASQEKLLNLLSGESMGLSASLQRWAIELGIERRTLETRLINGGFTPPKKGEAITPKQVFDGLHGEKRAEQVRALKLENAERERLAKVEDGRLFPMDELEAVLSERYLQPIDAVFNGMAAAIDTRCNPSDPKRARHAIEAYIEATIKPLLRKTWSQPQRK